MQPYVDRIGLEPVLEILRYLADIKFPLFEAVKNAQHHIGVIGPSALYAFTPVSVLNELFITA